LSLYASASLSLFRWAARDGSVCSPVAASRELTEERRRQSWWEKESSKLVSDRSFDRWHRDDGHRIECPSSLSFPTITTPTSLPFSRAPWPRRCLPRAWPRPPLRRPCRRGQPPRRRRQRVQRETLSFFFFLPVELALLLLLVVSRSRSKLRAGRSPFAAAAAAAADDDDDDDDDGASLSRKAHEREEREERKKNEKTGKKNLLSEKELHLLPCFLLLSPCWSEGKGKHIPRKKMTHRPDSAASQDVAGFPGSPLQDRTCGEVRGTKARNSKRLGQAHTIKGARRRTTLCFKAEREAGGGRDAVRARRLAKRAQPCPLGLSRARHCALDGIPSKKDENARECSRRGRERGGEDSSCVAFPLRRHKEINRIRVSTSMVSPPLLLRPLRGLSLAVSPERRREAGLHGAFSCERQVALIRRARKGCSLFSLSFDSFALLPPAVFPHTLLLSIFFFSSPRPPPPLKTTTTTPTRARPLPTSPSAPQASRSVVLGPMSSKSSRSSPLSSSETAEGARGRCLVSFFGFFFRALEERG